jgi:hypothetical protein
MGFAWILLAGFPHLFRTDEYTLDDWFCSGPLYGSLGVIVKNKIIKKTGRLVGNKSSRRRFLQCTLEFLVSSLCNLRNSSLFMENFRSSNFWTFL